MLLLLPKRRALGFSLVELMVSIAVGLIVLAAVTAVFSSMSRSNLALANTSQQIQNGSYAAQFLSDDLRHAGYYGGVYNPAAPLAALPDPCVTNNVATLRAALALPVQGYDAPAAPPVACIPASDFVPGTDVLVVRRVSTVLTLPASLSAQDVYVQNNNDWTDANNPVLNNGLAANFPLLNKDGVTAADIRKYYVRIYYVSPCNVYAPGANACTAAADAGNPVPTLKMLELQASAGGPTLTSVAIAQGVENLQIDYGIDATGEGLAQNFVSIPASMADWTNVVELKLSMLVRNPQATLNYADAKTYTLGSVTVVTPGGPFKRHVFTQQVRLTNVAETRETP
jgi:type IV pilus assembly protein PilW